MSDLNLNMIFNQYQENKIDKNTLLNYLKYYIENSQDLMVVENALKLFIEIEKSSKNLYQILEQLLLSDTTESVRYIAAEEIIKNYLAEGKRALQWVFENEKSGELLFKILKLLKSFDNEILIHDMEIALSKDFIKYNLIQEEGLFLGLLKKASNNIVFYIDKDVGSRGEFYFSFKTKNGHITELYCRDGFPNLKMLKHFDSLKKIHIFSEGIKDYNDLGKLTQLEILILEDTIFNKKSDLKWLNNLVNLRELEFICTTIKEISYLDNLVNLEKLVINGCEDSGWRGYISEIKGLDNLLNLTDLNLSLNRITEIKGLNNLSKLKYIDLSENNIWEIRDISNFKNLKRLKLVGNPIKNLP